MNTRFYFAPPVEKTHSLEGVSDLTPPKSILILDDDATFADLTRMILEENGFSVEVVGDGVQGIKKIMAADYSIILCDMVMPNCPGDMFYTAVERVKPHLCKRFLFMTGHRGERKVDEFIRRVHGLTLWKPFQSHVLLESIQVIEQKCNQS